MSTKLFRALVGLGISIGGAVAACDDAIDITPLTSSSAHGDASADALTDVPSEAGASDAAAADGDVLGDGGDLDGAVASDAARADALADAFCDNTWPTTKGTATPPSCIDPSGLCWDAAAPIRCMATLGPHQCDISSSGVASSCVFVAEAGLTSPDADDDGGATSFDHVEWMCPPNTIPMDQCWCYGELGDGQVCTDAGPKP